MTEETRMSAEPCDDLPAHRCARGSPRSRRRCSKSATTAPPTPAMPAPPAAAGTFPS